MLENVMAKVGQAQETSMEDILASIRRIISDDDGGRTGNAPHLAVVKSSPLPTDPAPTPQAPVSEAPAAPIETTVKPVELSPLPDPVIAAEKTAEASPLREPAAAERQDALTHAANALADFSLDDDDDEIEFPAAPAAARVEARPLPPPRPAATPLARTPLFTPSPRPSEPSPAVAAAAKIAETQPSSAGASIPTDVKLLSPGADQAVQSAFNQLTSIMLGNEARTLEDLVKDMMRPMLRDWLDDNLPPLVERLVREEIERVSRGRR